MNIPWVSQSKGSLYIDLTQIYSRLPLERLRLEQKPHSNNISIHPLMMFFFIIAPRWRLVGASLTLRRCLVGAQLAPGWRPVGARLAPGWCHVGAPLVPRWRPVGASLVPRWCLVGASLAQTLIPASFSSSNFDYFLYKKSSTSIYLQQSSSRLL